MKKRYITKRIRVLTSTNKMVLIIGITLTGLGLIQIVLFDNQMQLDAWPVWLGLYLVFDFFFFRSFTKYYVSFGEDHVKLYLPEMKKATVLSFNEVVHMQIGLHIVELKDLKGETYRVDLKECEPECAKQIKNAFSLLLV